MELNVDVDIDVDKLDDGDDDNMPKRKSHDEIMCSGCVCVCRTAAHVLREVCTYAAARARSYSLFMCSDKPDDEKKKNNNLYEHISYCLCRTFIHTEQIASF